MSIQAYLNEFDKRLFKTKFYCAEMADDILIYRLLKSANFSSYHEELVKQPYLICNMTLWKISSRRSSVMHQGKFQQNQRTSWRRKRHL